MKILIYVIFSLIFVFRANTQEKSKLFLDEYALGVNYSTATILDASQNDFLKNAKSIKLSNGVGFNFGIYHTYNKERLIKIKLGFEYNYTETQVTTKYDYEKFLADSYQYSLINEKIKTKIHKHTLAMPFIFRYDLSKKHTFYFDLGLNYNLFTLFYNNYSVDYYELVQLSSDNVYFFKRNYSNHSEFHNKRLKFELVGGVGFKPSIFKQFSVKLSYKYSFYSISNNYMYNPNNVYSNSLVISVLKPNYLTISINYHL